MRNGDNSMTGEQKCGCILGLILATLLGVGMWMNCGTPERICVSGGHLYRVDCLDALHRLEERKTNPTEEVGL